MSSERYLNISQASKASGKSIPTIRAYLDRGQLPNAKATVKGKTKAWRIPLTDLVAAGLMDSVKTPALKPSEAPQKPASASPELLDLREQNAALRAENQQLRERLEEAKQARADLIAAYAHRLETAQVQNARRSFWERLKG